MSETDKQLADRVLQGLTTARYIHPGPAFRQIGVFREDVGSGGNVERERADAWLAICALHDALAGKTRGGDMDSRWSRAIKKIEAWHASIK